VRSHGTPGRRHFDESSRCRYRTHAPLAHRRRIPSPVLGFRHERPAKPRNTSGCSAARFCLASRARSSPSIHAISTTIPRWRHATARSPGILRRKAAAADADRPIHERVTEEIRTVLLTGQPVRLHAVASSWAGARRLQQLLRLEGAGFQRLVDAVRRDLALQCLRGREMSCAKSRSSGFRRAEHVHSRLQALDFRTPADYRPGGFQTPGRR